MKTVPGLALIAVGAILAFAVTGHPGWLNVQVVGWVLMLVGLAGLFIPRRGYGWLRRRMVVRRPGAARRAALARNGTTLPAGAVVLTPEEAEAVEAGALEPEVFPGRQLSKAEAEQQVAASSPLNSTSETIEEYLEE